MGKALKRFAITMGVAGLGLAALYRYQPQRYRFKTRPYPEENPPIDPASLYLFSPNSSVMIVVAHPDDAEFFLGGMLALLAEQGARVGLIVTTDGDKGYYPFVNAERNRSIRRMEQLESATQFGCQDVTFLGYRDGRLKNTPELVRQIRDTIQSFGAEYVLTFDPLYEPTLQHSDHLRTGEAVAEAVKQLPDVEWLLNFSTAAPNFAVDITDVWPEKRRLLANHRSQFGGRKLKFIEDLVRDRAARDGSIAGVPLAEVFRVVRTIG